MDCIKEEDARTVSDDRICSELLRTYIYVHSLIQLRAHVLICASSVLLPGNPSRLTKEQDPTLIVPTAGPMDGSSFFFSVALKDAPSARGVPARAVPDWALKRAFFRLREDREMA